MYLLNQCPFRFSPQKLDETEKKKEARFSQMEEKIRENIDTVFNEKWDLMNRRVASLWKETTKDVLQVRLYELKCQAYGRKP